MRSQKISYSFPKPLVEVHSRIVSAGYQCYLVGGAVRSIVLKQDPKDWDLATDATPEELSALFRAVIPTGIKHGTVTILYKGMKFETTTFRIEGPYSDARHPDYVAYTDILLEDLNRRDFTINAMAIEPDQKILIDPFRGQEDCNAGIVRALGDPYLRFKEDALRILRAVRFSSQLLFTIEQETLKAMQDLSSLLSSVSAERIREEMDKIMASPKPSKGFLILADTGILSIIFPELEACRGVEQKGFHAFDVFHHSILCCDFVPPTHLAVRWAALLHDIGKPLVKTLTAKGEVHFHTHEQEGAKVAQALLRRLRFPTAFEKKVVHLVLHHMFHYEENWSDAAVRRFVRRVGRENLEDLFTLREADARATAGNSGNPQALSQLRKRIARVLAQPAPLNLKDLAVNGNDLAEEVGIPRGPNMGQVLNFLLEAVLEDPSLNTRERLLTLAKNFYQSRLSVPKHIS
ncbi:MAG: CCA tRNA nucleotidyltransferase [Spirochaetales bacterium]